MPTLVVSFYAHQVSYLMDLRKDVEGVGVCTVDSAIGSQEARVVISPVCQKQCGFLVDRRPVNVAISRVQNELYIVGHRKFWWRQRNTVPALTMLARLPANMEEFCVIFSLEG